MDIRGLRLCAKYAASPNFLGYCGPRQSANLIDHLKEDAADGEMLTILSEFETLYPYLRLISRLNHIEDPFSLRVVEAYWIGNNLLDGISARDTYALLKEKMSIERMLEPVSLMRLKRKLLTLRYLPHHAFHVFNIFKRTGKTMGVHSLDTMDACRVGWGRVAKVGRRHQTDEVLFVRTQSLIINDTHLALGQPITREVQNGFRGKRFLAGIAVGDWISYHWGFACDRLSQTQIKHLVYYTKKAIDYYNGLYL